MTEETRRELLPSATGFAARQAIAVLRKRNVPATPLLMRAGISEGDIDNGQGRISALAQGKLLEYAAEALGDSEFGLHLAEQANPREAGLLFYVASAAEHVGDALALTARYCRIGNEAERLVVNRSSENMIVETKFVGLPRQFAWQNTEFVIAATIRALREMAGRDFQPVQVGFTLARYSELSEFERLFGCPVEFSAQLLCFQRRLLLGRAHLADLSVQHFDLFLKLLHCRRQQTDIRGKFRCMRSRHRLASSYQGRTK